MSSHRLLLELGRGGMGTVYLAVTKGLGDFTKLKVIKQLRDDLADNRELLQMFLDEARLSARLNHVNIVQTNEVGFLDGHHYIEMEYLEGQSLEGILRRTKNAGAPLRLVDGVWILSKVLAALHYAHTLTDLAGKPLRIVHRDVSPHNVFVTYGGVVKLLDFGIAKAADSGTDTATGVIKGKVRYMAPEQAHRKPLDGRADVFAVGVMLWQIATGERVWSELSDFEVYLRLDTGAIPTAHSVNPSVDPAIDEICRKAMAASPADRYATAAEMRAALDAWLKRSDEETGEERVGALLTEIFAERRAAVQREIERNLARADAPDVPSAPDVPALADSVAYQSTATAPRSAAPFADPEPQPTKILGKDARPAVRDREDSTRTSHALPDDAPKRAPTRWWAFGAAALGLVGVAGLWRARPSPHVEAASTVPAAASAAGVRECTTNADCSRDGASGAARCAPESGRCVPFEAPGCEVVASAAARRDDRTLWIAAMAPLAGWDADAYGWAARNAFALAQKDFDLVPSTSLRPVGLLFCDSSKDARAEAAHIAAIEAASVLLGVSPSNDTAGLTAHTFLPHHVLVFNAGIGLTPAAAVDPEPGQPRLAWLGDLTRGQLAESLAHLVNEFVEPLVHKEHPGGGTPRVALLRAGMSTDYEGTESFVSELRLDGKKIVEVPSAFRQFIASPEKDAGADDEKAVSELLDFQPDVIATSSFTALERVLARLEQRWPQHAPRPIYATEGSPWDPFILSFVGKSAERRHRFFGIDLPANTQPNLNFVLRYNEFYTPPVTIGSAQGVFYDIFYLAAYAGLASDPDSKLDPKDMSAALGRFSPDGVPLDVGPSHIEETVRALRSGKSIDLHGAGSRIRLDPATGMMHSDLALYCLNTSRSGQVNESVESGIILRSSDGSLSGTLKCP